MSRQPSRGAVHLPYVFALTALSLAQARIRHWYVGVNAPSCGTGIGTEADPFCDIMDAVAVATDGDTIHIAPGTYFENVVLDKDLELIGSGGDAVTILDGMASGSVVQVSAADVTLRGLTLTNGTGTLGSYGTYGGGMFAHDSNGAPPHPRVVLSGSTVTDNTADEGGGVHALRVRLEVEDSTIRANVATGGGGGVTSQGWLTLTNTSLSGNSASRGGGLWARGVTMITSSAISRNTATYSCSYGGDVYLGAGGIDHGGDLILLDSTVEENTGHGVDLSPSYFCHPTLGCTPVPSFVSLRNATVSRHTGFGIQVGRYLEEVEVANLSVTDNAWAGVRVGLFSAATLTNVTLAGNGGPALEQPGFVGYYGCTPEVEVRNSVLWDNAASIDLVGSCAAIVVEECLVEGGWPGVGNLDADPLFVDPLNGDYRLLPGSPSIDAGDNLAVPLDLWTDLDGKFRFIDGTGAGLGPRLLPRVDLGAFEFGSNPPRKVRQR
jgi:hypothetical protein